MTTQFNDNRNSDRLLRLPEVMKRTGLGRSSIYQHISENAFPSQISLGPRSVGWLESEINDWITRRIASSRSHIPKPT